MDGGQGQASILTGALKTHCPGVPVICSAGDVLQIPSVIVQLVPIDMVHIVPGWPRADEHERHKTVHTPG